MNVYANDRAELDVDPSTESWLYRSEGFAEDLDYPAPVTVAGPSGAANRRRATSAVTGTLSEALSNLWMPRPHGAG